MKSDLAYWYLSKRGSILRGGYLEFHDWLVNLMPVPMISKEAQQPFKALSEELRALAKERADLSARFTSLLSEELALQDLGSKLKNWHDLTFKQFLDALKSKKVKLSGQAKEEWMERFERLGTQIKDLETALRAKKAELNHLVEELYGLSEDEVAYYRQHDSKN